MDRRLTIRGLSDETFARLEALSREKGQCLNSTVLEILEHAVRADRRRHLERYATWTPEDLREFESALAVQRTLDSDPGIVGG
jgi:hypothetical protein